MKMCEICGKNRATVPDRERMGRLINRVCSPCHSLRLRGDIVRALINPGKRGVVVQDDEHKIEVK